jgi:hypothetical protein
MYEASINEVGKLPISEKTRLFDGLKAAWAHLRDERQREEDRHRTDLNGHEYCEYSDTWSTLDYLASADHEPGNPHENWPLAPDGTGVIYGEARQYVHLEDGEEAGERTPGSPQL